MRGLISSFPDTFASVDQALLMRAYEEGPLRLGKALTGLRADEWDARVIDGKWTINQIVLHIADSEMMGALRARLVMAADEPGLPGYDQDRWAADLRYEPFNLNRMQNTLGLFGQLRATTAYLFAHAKPRDWDRVGVHPEHGPVTLRNLLELYADHSERHIEQILARRQLLGHDVKFVRLLPALLY